MILSIFACVVKKYKNFVFSKNKIKKSQFSSHFITIAQMYGRYTKNLSEYAKDEARRLKQLERQRKKDDRARNKVNR